MRTRVERRDVARDAAARRLGLNQDEFDARYDNLIARVPAPDPDTGNFDLHAFEPLVIRPRRLAEHRPQGTVQ